MLAQDFLSVPIAYLLVEISFSLEVDIQTGFLSLRTYQ